MTRDSKEVLKEEIEEFASKRLNNNSILALAFCYNTLAAFFFLTNVCCLNANPMDLRNILKDSLQIVCLYFFCSLCVAVLLIYSIFIHMIK